MIRNTVAEQEHRDMALCEKSADMEKDASGVCAASQNFQLAKWLLAELFIFSR